MQHAIQRSASAYRGRKVAKLAVAVAVLQAQDLEGIGHYHALDGVIGGGDTLKALEAVKRCTAALGLVWHHAV